MVERTLVIIKPDACKNGHIGEIISFFEKNRLKIRAMKLIEMDKTTAEKFYEEHKGKDFFEGLVEFMTSGPVVIMVIEGENVIGVVRKMIGATDPKKAEPGTIRYMYGSGLPSNAIHASADIPSAKREVAFFFPELSW